MPGTLYLVATPIGNLDDMPPRVAATFGLADFVAAEDTRVTLRLLNHLGLKKPMVSYYEHALHHGEAILNRIEAGENCALCSDAGMPCISDPGEQIVREAHERGIRVVPIPAASACVTALAASGQPTARFVFEGFLPVPKRDRRERLAFLQNETRTMIFYEAPHKLCATLRDLAAAFGGERRISLCRELTKLHEEVLRLTLDGAMETEDCVRALMEALLAGPDEPSLSSPIPEGTVLKSLKVSGRRAQIDLSAQYARLTGIDLSLADYCITLTLTQLPNVNAVSITADGRELPYRETQVLLSADTLLSSRESGLRPITVSLYFLDSKTGELRAEQQTLALYEGQTRVNALLEALAQGPEDDSLVSLLPEDFAVISSRIENGVCYLNLPASGSLPENEAERDLMLSALEQSILSLGGVDEVQFLIEGSAEPDGYR